MVETGTGGAIVSGANAADEAKKFSAALKTDRLKELPLPDSAGTQLIEIEAVVVGQPAQHFVGGQLVLLQVQLAAVAGREDRRLAAGREATELLQGLDQLLGGEGHALADVHRGGLVVDTEGEEGHAGSLDRFERPAIVLRHPRQDNWRDKLTRSANPRGAVGLRPPLVS